MPGEPNDPPKPPGLAGAPGVRLIPRPQHEDYVGSSFQFLLPGWEPARVAAFVAGAGDRWFADLYALARLRLQGDQRQGDLYARWRALSVGMEVRGPQRTLHLVRAKAWYDGRPHYLK